MKELIFKGEMILDGLARLGCFIFQKTRDKDPTSFKLDLDLTHIWFSLVVVDCWPEDLS